MGPKTGPIYILIQKVGKHIKEGKSINCKIKLSKEISVILS